VLEGTPRRKFVSSGCPQALRGTYRQPDLQASHRNDSLGGVTEHSTIRHARIYLLLRSRVYIYCRTYI
jgi:hypothetical protein